MGTSCKLHARHRSASQRIAMHRDSLPASEAWILLATCRGGCVPTGLPETVKICRAFRPVAQAPMITHVTSADGGLPSGD